MNRVDADRLKRMPPDTFEKFLPFAMALGVEHQWAARSPASSNSRLRGMCLTVATPE